MKEYLLLLRAGTPMSEKTAEENNQDMEAWKQYMGDLMKNGKMTGGMPLASGGKTVFSHTTVDLPVNAASEGIVGGYLMVKADSLEAAVELALACPHLANKGNIEVREIAPMPAM